MVMSEFRGDFRTFENVTGGGWWDTPLEGKANAATNASNTGGSSSSWNELY
jgi:hypothetical protein